MATTIRGAETARHRAWAEVLKASGLIWALVLLCVIAALISPRFVNPANLVNVLRQVALYGIVSVGLTFVILTRGIDLSVGSLVGVVAVSTALLLGAGVPIPATILVGLLVGVALGALNGVGVVFGGEGGIGGTIIGAAILAVIANILNLTGVSPFTQQVVKGAIIIGAVLIETLRHRRR